MPIDIVVPRQSGAPLQIAVDMGQIVFVLGANGTGKSSLMHRFYTTYSSAARRITAHRQTWFASSSSSLSHEQKRQTELQMQNNDRTADARWKDVFAAQRPDIAITDLVNAENTRARTIAHAVDVNDIPAAQLLSGKDAPIKIINELLRLSSIPIVITITQNEQVLASKSGSAPYGAAELSDGERNTLLIAASVLTAAPGTLLLIDEPERHLHRSIISPLLTLLFAKRSDCAFIISTHDVLLPLDNRKARTFLLRSCTYAGAHIAYWDVDLLPADAPIDDDIKKDILGSRRKVLFVEGDENSLDKPLYSLIFPEISVIAKAGCNDVETAVAGIRAAPDLHWVHAFGIVDNDRRVQAEIDRLKANGVYALAVHTVESIYYHSEIQRRVAVRHAGVTGENPASRVAAARSAALASVAPDRDRLSSRAIEKAIRHQIDVVKPTQAQIATGATINITVDVAAALAAERATFDAHISAQDLEAIICRYPVRETRALTEIVRRLGFQDRTQYESAVKKLLLDDATALTFVRTLFGTLFTDITT
jgi:ABC-type cobalamin/Fe3+-siderophores transport system ATPase subunit